MSLEGLIYLLNLPVFGLVAARLAGFIMFQPVLAALAIPAQVRVAVVLALAALMTPLVRLHAGLPDTPATLALALGGELLVGITVGLVLRIGFAALQLGGLMIAQESGLAFGQIVDPVYGQEESILSTTYAQVAVVVYLLLGGHRELLAACLDTFQAVPLLTHPASMEAALQLVLAALASGGELTLRVAAPVLLTLMLVNLVLGFLSRTLPQINVTTVGFALKTPAAFFVMAAALPAVVEAFSDELGGLVRAVRAFLVDT